MTLLASCESPFAPEVTEVGRIDVSPNVLTMVVGGEATLVARVYGAGDNVLPDATVYWSSQDPSVVTINQNGIVNAVAAGTAQIAASSGGLSRTIAVTVAQRPIALIRISPPAGNVVVGQTLVLQGEALDGTGALLTNRILDWTTSAPTIATVSTTGIVTGVAVGQATISATGEGKVGTSIITVLPTPVTSILVQPDGGSLPAGGTLQLTATPRDATGQPLTGRTLEWRSSNDAVATVSSNGLLTAISPGTVTITVSAPGGGPNGSTPSATVNVTVLIAPVATAIIVPSPAGVQIGQTLALTLNLQDSNGEPLSPAGRTIAWNSSNPAVATVNSSGVITGVSGGTSSVTATITTPGQANAVQATVQVNVSAQPVASVVITPTPATVHVGYFMQLSAVAFDAAGQPLPGRQILWTSGNQAIAAVDAANGVVAGLAQGAVQIRATSEGVQAVANVTVDLVRVTSVSVTPPAAALMPAQTVQLTAVARDSAGTAIFGAALGGRGTTWSTGNAAAATVSAGGLVTAVAQGAATISASIGGAVGQAAITVNPLPTASQLAITTQPSASPANDAAFPVQPVIQLKDINGNNVSTAGVVIQAAITAPGTGTLGGSTSATTDATGAATFTGLKITGLTGIRTLTFTSGALAPVTSSPVNVQPGVATQLALTTPPPVSANSGQVFSSASVVQLRDISGNNVPQGGVLVTASVQPSAGVTLGGGSVTTSASGAATFGALTLTGPAGSYALTFSSGVLAPVTSGSITLGAGSGSKLSIAAPPPSSVPNGQPFGAVIQLLDGSNNPVAQAGVQVSVAILTGGGVLGGTTVVSTNASGVASFSGLTITGTIGTRTLLFGAAGYTAVTSSAIDVTPGTPAALAITAQPPATAQSGAAFSGAPAVRLVDASGNTVPQNGVPVAVSLNGAGGTLTGSSTATTTTGVATFSGLGISGTVGTYSLSFSSAGLTGATSSSITLTAGAAAQLTITTQPGGAASGAAFTTQPAIQVRDAQGNPVSQAGLTITASIASGGPATLLGSSQATTNGSGVATFTGLGLSGTAGNYTIAFASSPLAGATSAQFSLTHGAAAQLAILTQPAGAASGAAFTTQPAIQVRDAQSNPVTQAGISISASVNGGGAALVGSGGAVTDGSGIATFSGLGLSGTVGSYTLDFASSGVPNVTSAPITLAAGAAAQLVLVSAPGSPVSTGSTFSPQPSVQVRDAGGNNVAVAGINVTAGISAGGASLTGTTTVATNGTGLATFANLGVTGTIGVYTLSFSGGSLNPATSSPITVQAGPPSQLTITTPPAGAASGAAFTTQPVIQLRDAQGNAASVAGITVTASIASGTGTLVGSNTATTNGSGVAAFAGLGLSGTVGTFTIAFDAPSLTGTTSGPISLGPGAAAQLTIQTQPGGAASGAAFTTQPVILATDAQGNAINQSITITASVNGGGATLVGSGAATTNGVGVATFVGLGLSGTVGTYTLNFSATGVPTVTSGNIPLGPGAPSQLSVTTQPSSSANSGVALSQSPVVGIRDNAGNVVNASGIVVTAGITPSGASLSGSTSATTDGSGLATFGQMTINGLVNTYTLTFSAPGLTGTQSSAVVLGPGAVAQLSMATQPPASALSGAPLVPAPAVQLRDAAGNAIAQGGIDVSAAVTGGTVNNGLATTDVSGLATFNGISISAAAGNYPITFTSPGLTSATSSAVNITLPATQLAITAQPSTAVNGSTLGTITVALHDVNSNLVNQSGVQVSAALSSGSGSLGGTATATTTNGVASFPALVITGTVGPYTITFSSSGLTDAVSSAISLTHGAATNLVFNPAPPAAAASGVALATHAVQLKDATGNNVTTAGITVTVAVSPGSATMTGNSAVTDANGLATFGALTLTGNPSPPNYTLTYAATGVTGTVQAVIALSPFFDGDASPEVTEVTSATERARGATLTGVSISSGDRPVSLAGNLSGTSSSPANTVGMARLQALPPGPPIVESSRTASWPGRPGSHSTRSP